MNSEYPVHELLRLAARGRGKAFHLISTVATLPLHLGYEVSPTDSEYGYATSKFTAEQRVGAARWRGANASVYRLPFVAAALSGSSRRDRGDYLHNLTAGCMSLGQFPRLGSDTSMVLPVDYLAESVAAIMVEDTSRIGQDFDFVNGSSQTFEQYFDVIVEAGAGGKLSSFEDWKPLAMQYAMAHPHSHLARIASIIDDLDFASASAMFKAHRPGPHVLGVEGSYPAPPFNDVAARRYLQQIRAAAGSR